MWDLWINDLGWTLDFWMRLKIWDNVSMNLYSKGVHALRQSYMVVIYKRKIIRNEFVGRIWNFRRETAKHEKLHFNLFPDQIAHVKSALKFCGRNETFWLFILKSQNLSLHWFNCCDLTKCFPPHNLTSVVQCTFGLSSLCKSKHIVLEFRRFDLAKYQLSTLSMTVKLAEDPCQSFASIQVFQIILGQKNIFEMHHTTCLTENIDDTEDSFLYYCLSNERNDYWLSSFVKNVSLWSAGLQIFQNVCFKTWFNLTFEFIF